MLAAYLGAVFEGGEGDHASLAVEDRDGEVRGLNEPQHLRVRVDAVVNVVLTNLYQVYNLIAVIWVGAAQDDALQIEAVAVVEHLLLLVSVDVQIISFHLFLCSFSAEC